jgi:hypothetical protein
MEDPRKEEWMIVFDDKVIDRDRSQQALVERNPQIIDDPRYRAFFAPPNFVPSPLHER